ncbi:MAG: zinc ribbon domain-containing protein [Methanomicrobia archaeon]|nr:zinc ribbon domain-containing protein [Methanomicrobia archaeon]
MKYCPQCGFQNKEDSAFCENCGYKFEKEAKEEKKRAEESPSRWYFLHVGHAMAGQIYKNLCQNAEFTSIPAGKAEPQAKVLVRYYRADPSSGSYRAEEAQKSGLVFRGYGFPLKSGDPPEEVADIESAYHELGGLASSTLPEVPVMVILADSRFDDLMRGYCDFLNMRYLQSGALPIVKLLYTDDLKSARNLISLYRLKEKVDYFEERFKVWCEKMGIDPESFAREKKREKVAERPPVVFEDLNSFKKLIREHYNLAHSKLGGIIAPDTLLDVLSQIEHEISIYWSLGYGSAAFRSQFEINVFPKDQFGGNMGFIGLAEFQPTFSPFKYVEEYNFNKEEIGLVQGRIMSRFTFSMYHDNALNEDYLKRFEHKLVSVDELRERIKERQAKLGLK